MNLNNTMVKDRMIYFVSNIGVDLSDLLKCNRERRVDQNKWESCLMISVHKVIALRVYPPHSSE